MRYLKIAACLLVIGALTSCDPGIRFQKIIENRSDYDVKVYIYRDTSQYYEVSYLADSLLIGNHSEMVLAETGGLGQYYKFTDCQLYADSLKIIVLNNDSITVNMDINDPASWHFRRTKFGSNGGGECECRLMLSDIHFQ